MKAVEYSIRNAVKDVCDECGKEVIYEKDDDSGLDSIEVEPMVWKQLCEECADEQHERERRLNAQDEDEEKPAPFILTDRRDGADTETQTGFADLSEAFTEGWHIVKSGREFVDIRAGKAILYDRRTFDGIVERMQAIYQEGKGESIGTAARRVAADLQ